MASFDDFADNLRSYLPGAFDEAVKVQFYDAAREFYRRSRSWIEAIEVAPDLLGYVSLEPVSDRGDICYLEGIYSEAGGGPHRRYASEGPAQQLALATSGGFTSYATLTSPTDLYVSEGFAADTRLYLDVSMQPRLAADYLPSIALTHHHVGLKAGALGYMMAQPAKPYTNAGQSAFWQRKFEVEIIRAREMQTSGFAAPTRAPRIPTVPVR